MSGQAEARTSPESRTGSRSVGTRKVQTWSYARAASRNDGPRTTRPWALLEAWVQPAENRRQIEKRFRQKRGSYSGWPRRSYSGDGRRYSRPAQAERRRDERTSNQRRRRRRSTETYPTRQFRSWREDPLGLDQPGRVQNL